MASVASQLIEEAAHAQTDGLEDAQEICADGTYFPNNVRKLQYPPLPLFDFCSFFFFSFSLCFSFCVTE